MVVALQVATVLLSRGDIMLLGEAYAFGVVWSFAMKSLSALVLRFNMPDGREWRVLFNIRAGGIGTPVGLGLITLLLLALAIVNVITKEVATTASAAFTVLFFTIFQMTDSINRHNVRERKENSGLEKFRLVADEGVSSKNLAVRSGNVLVAVRNPTRLVHLERVLQRTYTNKLHAVVFSVRPFVGEHMRPTDELFAERGTDLLSHVVSLAKKEGKHVKLLVILGREPMEALAPMTARLGSSRIVVGTSPRQSVPEQGIELGSAWEKLAEPRPALSLEVVPDDGSISALVNLGPHPPRLWPQGLDLLYKLWLELSDASPRYRLQDRDVVGFALHRLKNDLYGRGHDEFIAAIGDVKGQDTAPSEPEDPYPVNMS